MKKRGNNKKAQFYLIATIIIVSLFLSFVAVLNYSIKRENLVIYDLAEELNIEGQKVLDYEQYSGDSVFDEFAESYSDYVGNERRIYFLVGDDSNPEAFYYDEGSKNTISRDVSEGEATIEIEGNEYTFELNPGQNFYFVITEEYKGQEYFITNQ